MERREIKFCQLAGFREFERKNKNTGEVIKIERMINVLSLGGRWELEVSPGLEEKQMPEGVYGTATVEEELIEVEKTNQCRQKEKTFGYVPTRLVGFKVIDVKGN